MLQFLTITDKERRLEGEVGGKEGAPCCLARGNNYLEYHREKSEGGYV